MKAGLRSRPEGGSGRRWRGPDSSFSSAVVKSSARFPNASSPPRLACLHCPALASGCFCYAAVYRCSLKKTPACASARRPGSRWAFQRGQAWIMCGQISRVAETSAAPAAAAKRTASSSRVSAEPIWMRVGSLPFEIRVERREARVLPVHALVGDKGLRQPLQVPLLDKRIDGAFAQERRSSHREIDPWRAGARALQAGPLPRA